MATNIYLDRLEKLEARVMRCETDMSVIKDTLSTVSDDAAAIKAVVVGTTKTMQFIKRNSPRAIAFGLGLAVSNGWLSPSIFETIGKALELTR